MSSSVVLLPLKELVLWQAARWILSCQLHRLLKSRTGKENRKKKSSTRKYRKRYVKGYSTEHLVRWLKTTDEDHSSLKTLPYNCFESSQMKLETRGRDCCLTKSQRSNRLTSRKNEGKENKPDTETKPPQATKTEERKIELRQEAKTMHNAETAS